MNCKISQAAIDSVQASSQSLALPKGPGDGAYPRREGLAATGWKKCTVRCTSASARASIALMAVSVAAEAAAAAAVERSSLVDDDGSGGARVLVKTQVGELAREPMAMGVASGVQVTGASRSAAKSGMGSAAIGFEHRKY